MTRTHRTPPRWLRWTLVSVAVVLGCLVWGVTTARADLSLGPHEALYEVTTDDTVTADLGPLGTLEIDSPLPLTLGVRVTVQEIPADLTAVDQAATLDALGGDLQSYLQFFASPAQTVGHVARSLLLDALARAGLALLGVVGVGALGYVVLGRARRGELARTLAPRTWEITAGVVVVSLVGVSLTASGVGRPETEPTHASTVFDGTALEGARITGRLAGVVDTYGGQLVNLYRQNEQFYAVARANLAEAWDERQEEQEAQALAAAREGAAPTDGTDGTDGTDDADGSVDGSLDGTGGTGGTDGAENADGADGSADDAGAADAPDVAAAEPSASPTGSPTADDEDLVTLLVVSDLHCNTGMTPLIRDVAEKSGAQIVLNAGDTTMNGTAVEQVCVDSFLSAVPKGATMVVSDGNHDSVITSRQERAKGATILDGSVIEVAGVRILGDRDPLETRVGVGTSTTGEETPREAGERLAQVACDDEQGVDLLLIHTPSVGDAGLDSGCVPLQVSGHTHLRKGPEPTGLGVRYVSGSTAGALAGQPTVGPLHGTAEMTLLRFDPATRQFVDWQLLTVAPDQTAEVGPRRPLPERPTSLDSGVDLDGDGVPDAPADPAPGTEGGPQGGTQDGSQDGTEEGSPEGAQDRTVDGAPEGGEPGAAPVGVGPTAVPATPARPALPVAPDVR